MLLKSVLPLGAKRFLNRIIDERIHGYALKSYSQEGEDMVLRRIFEYQKSGFYVDIGAHHPKRFSNTYFFYKLGWRGINIDAMPGSMKAFEKVRPKDINIETPVSEKEEKLTYYAFTEPALNGFSKELSESRLKENGIQLVFKKEMNTVSLSRLLDKYLPENTHIDFLSIDVEGLDLQVLRSNNWNKYLPTVVLVEAIGTSYSKLLQNSSVQFLQKLGYEVFAKSFNTIIFMQTHKLDSLKS